MRVILVLASACLVLASGAALAEPVRTAQVGPAAGQAAVDRARGEVDAAIRERDGARRDKAELARAYDSQLAEIDRLKQARASWRRDRMIRERMSASHVTAEKLSRMDSRLRELEQAVRARQAALVKAIDRELGQNPAAGRRAQLLGWRQAAQGGLRRGVKKIVIPDDTIDPLADPEELEYQAALLGQSEAQLARELARLDARAQRYERMVALQKTRKRETELGGLDDDQPRRTLTYATERAVAEDNAADPASAPPTESGDGPPVPTGPADSLDGGDNPMFDVVLADVVDEPTVRALKQAEQSRDPALRARAAQEARKQVQERLKKLQKRRQLIEKRARRLRN